MASIRLCPFTGRCFTHLLFIHKFFFRNKKARRQVWRVAGRESGSPELLESPRTSPEVPRTSLRSFGDFPGNSLTVELNTIQNFPGSFPGFPGSFPDFLFIEGVLKRYAGIGDHPKKVLPNPPKGSIEPLKAPGSILDGQKCQSPIASVQRTRSTLASHSAVPCGTNVKRTNTNRATRIAAQRTQGL